MQDLNVNPNFPFEDNSFDVITNVVRNLLSVFQVQASDPTHDSQ